MAEFKLRDVFIKANKLERWGPDHYNRKGVEEDINLNYASRIRAGEALVNPKLFSAFNIEKGTLLTVEGEDYFVKMTPDDFKKKYGEPAPC